MFFFGDLNYSISMNCDRTRYSREEHWRSMLHCDELRREMELGNVFAGYREGGIMFGPTCKFVVGSNEWDMSGKDPAWCDRILWKGDRAKAVAYQSMMGNLLSTHKPVYGRFEIHNDLLVPFANGNSRVMHIMSYSNVCLSLYV